MEYGLHTFKLLVLDDLFSQISDVLYIMGIYAFIYFFFFFLFASVMFFFFFFSSRLLTCSKLVTLVKKILYFSYLFMHFLQFEQRPDLKKKWAEPVFK